MNTAMRKLMAASLALLPGAAMAEPAVSGGYIPLLWVFALALSAGVAWLIAAGIARLAGIRDRRYRWTVAVVLFLTFAIFLAPFIVVFGSILVTGRTM